MDLGLSSLNALSTLTIDQLAWCLKTPLTVQEVLGYVPGFVKSDAVSPAARHRCEVLRSCVALVVRRGDGPRPLVTCFGVRPRL